MAGWQGKSSRIRPRCVTNIPKLHADSATYVFEFALYGARTTVCIIIYSATSTVVGTYWSVEVALFAIFGSVMFPNSNQECKITANEVFDVSFCLQILGLLGHVEIATAQDYNVGALWTDG